MARNVSFVTDIVGVARRHPVLADPGVHVFLDDPELVSWRGKNGERMDVGLVASTLARDRDGVPRPLRRIVSSSSIPERDYVRDLAREQGIKLVQLPPSEEGMIRLATEMLTTLVEGATSTLSLLVGQNAFQAVLETALTRGWRVELVCFDREAPASLKRLAHLIRRIGPDPVHLH